MYKLNNKTYKKSIQYKMKKNLIIICGLLMFSTNAFAEKVSNSEINWISSNLTITNFVKRNIEDPDFTCSYGALNTQIPLSDINFSSTAKKITDLAEGNINDCFQQAGTYIYTIKLIDMAGNEASKNFNLEIYPQKADATKSILEIPNTCNGIDLKNESKKSADGTDACEINIQFKDKFNNTFSKFNDGSGGTTNPIDIVPFFSGQVAATEYDFYSNFTEENAQKTFFNSLNIQENKIPLSNDGDSNIHVTAEAPSLKIHVPSEPDAKEEIKGSEFVSRNIQFDFTLPTIEKDGTLVPNSTEDLQKNGELAFNPLLKNTINISEIQIGKYIDVIQEFTNTGNISNAEASLIGIALKDTIFDTEDINQWYPQNIIISGGAFSPLKISSKLFSTENFLETNDLDIPFFTKIKYAINSKNVIYPAAFSGCSYLNCPNCIGNDNTCTQLEIVGADIEGAILGGKNIVINKGTSFNLTNIGSSNQIDIREAITTSAYDIIRGLTSKQYTLPLNGIDFTTNNEKVLYYKNQPTINLSGEIKGIGTIVIEDGNLLISKDLVYANSGENSLGIILINTDVKNRDNGNIFIDNDVHRIVGTYFSDGSLASTTVSNPTINDPVPDNFDLEKQLILNGTILTRNTLGGSKMQPYQTPWGETDSPELAQKYDLHFLRRYSGEGLPDCTTSRVDSLQCDSNNHAFIIRPDSKVTSYPPPGFTKFNTISQE